VTVLRWTQSARADLIRLHEFLVSLNVPSANRIIQSLVAAPKSLITFPRLGEPLEEFKPREIRRLIAGKYEIRYELREPEIFILRIWHTRENREDWTAEETPV
jgi:plasmid stabilization system protein ParE